MKKPELLLYRIEAEDGEDFYVDASSPREAILEAIKEGQEYAGTVRVFEQVDRGEFTVETKTVVKTKKVTP